ncbi:MAG: hypothetical protein HY791_38525 [Deltaproteobacteria bacterium]|nr:hypothetical protein [Deltaproteobacteria bacterium]
MALLLIAGCQSGPFVAIEAADLPEGFFLGFVFRDAEGVFAGSTALTRVDAGRVVLETSEAPIDAEEVFALAWSLETLAIQFPPPASELSEQPLALGAYGDIPLVAPDWQTRASVAGVRLEPMALQFALTAPWLPACDASLDGSGRCEPVELAAEISCGEGPMTCEIELRQSGCDVQLDAVRCGLDVLTAALATKSEVCVPVPSQGGCARNAEGVFDCGSCTVALRPKRALPELIASDRRAFLEVEPMSTPGLAPGRLVLDFVPPVTGYASDFAVNGDRALVVTLDGAFRDLSPLIWSGRVVSVDLRSLEVVASSTVPDSPRLVVADPTGEGFVVAFDEPLRVVRTDRDGRVLQLVEIPIDPVLRTSPGSFVVATGLVATESSVALAAWIDPRAPRGSREERASASIIRVLDAETLSVMAGRDFPLSRFRSLMWSPRVRREWVVADDLSNSILTLDRSDLTLRTVIAIEPRGVSAGFDRVLEHAASGTLVLPVVSSSPGVHVLAGNADTGRSGFFEPMAVPMALAEWPMSGRVLVAALSSSFETHLALFDPSTRRFLPGSTSLGFGPVRRLVDDGEGNLLALLPWSAELVRLRPAR